MLRTLNEASHSSAVVRWSPALFSLAILLLLLLGGCSDELLLGEGNDSDALRVNTIVDGTFIGPGDEIPIAIGYSNTSAQVVPNRMELFVDGSDGERVAERLVRSSTLLDAPIPGVVLPTLDDGLYDMEIALFQDNRLLNKERRSFFYVSSNWNLLGVIAYPPYIQPNSNGVLKAQIDVPADADPYFIWHMQGRIIASGYLSQGMEQAQFQAPAVEVDSEEGIYLSRVDLYPVGPADGQSFEFGSQTNHAVEIVVRDEPFYEESDLDPSESYFSLLHFRGTLIEEGMRSELLGVDEQITAQPIGKPHLRLADDIFGYYLDSDDALLLNDIVLPMADNQLLPFALHFRLYAAPNDETENAYTLFHVETLDGKRLFALEIGASGTLQAYLAPSDNASGQSSDSGVQLPIARTFLLGVVVVPSETNTDFHWLLDNKLVGSSSITTALQLHSTIVEESEEASARSEVKPNSAEADSAESDSAESDSEVELPAWNRLAGHSYIGSPVDEGRGFSGILDEFGVYFRDPGTQRFDVEALLAQYDEEQQ